MTRVRSRLGTEFGRLLERLVVQTPGGVAAVLSDDVGEALDFAHDPAEISALDVQLLGAQIGQSLHLLDVSARRHRLRQPSLLLETPSQKLLAATLCGAFTLALLLDRRANIAKAFTTFETIRLGLERILGGL